MESTSTTKLDVIKPVFMKAGIPLAIAAAGFVFARIFTRRTDVSQSENQINLESESCSHDLESLDSSYLSCLDCNHSSPETSQQVQELEEEISVLRSQVNDLHVREMKLEIQYLHYRDTKGQELVVMELEKMLLLEITRAQLLDMDISAEAVRQRFQKMEVEYPKIIALLQFSRSSNRMLRRRIRKLLKKSKEQRQFIREQHKQIEAKGEENSITHEELVSKSEIIRKLEDQIQANKTASSKSDAEKANMEDNCSQVPTTETEELIYLRWSNACLRHELMRKNQEEQDTKQCKNPLEMNYGEIAYFGSDDEHDQKGHSTLEDGHSCLNLPTTIGHPSAHSKRKRFIKKLKRWVEGSDKEKHQVHTHARKSYSSA